MNIINAKDIQLGFLTSLIYAPPGLGKTTLLGNLKGRTLIIDFDRGTSVLAGKENIDILRPSDNLREVDEALRELNSKCEYDNVCLDSLSELERSMLTVLGRTGNNKGVPAIGDYNRVDFKIIDWCRQFRNIKANIFFTAWEAYKEIHSPAGDKFSQARPMLRDKNTENICGLCDIVGRIFISPKDNNRYVWLLGNQDVVAKDRIFKRSQCPVFDILNNNA